MKLDDLFGGACAAAADGSDLERLILLELLPLLSGDLDCCLAKEFAADFKNLACKSVEEEEEEEDFSSLLALPFLPRDLPPMLPVADG